MPLQLYLRQGSSISFSPSSDSIFILSVHATPDAPGIYSLHVEGVSRGSGSCRVALSLLNGLSTSSSAVSSSGFFQAAFSGLPLSAGSSLGIQAVNADSGSTGSDSVVIAFPHDIPIHLPAASTASLELQRFTYLAGNPDRTVNTKSFRQLISNHATKTNRLKKKHLVYGTSASKLHRLAFRDLFEKGKEAIHPLWKAFSAGKLRYPEFRFQANQALKETAKSLVALASEEESQEWQKLLFLERSEKAPKQPSPQAFRRKHFAMAGNMIAVGTGPLIDLRPDFDIPTLDDFFDLDILAFDDFAGRVGILFADRIRFQSAGLVVGEPIYTLALAPGEEVELRQVVETKRKSQLEDVVDREQEVSLNLTSSWTNEITEGLQQQSSVQSAVQIGINGDAKLPIPELPLGFGINASNNFSAADSLTKQQSVTNSFERTSEAASKMRAQHKIRMEVTNETSSSLSTTRKLRNANQQRSQIHVFSKVYRKERVTLERTDAQLCLRLVVNDPSFEPRSNFLANLDKFDPNNPAHYPRVPAAVSVATVLSFVPPSGWPDNDYNPFNGADSTQSIDLKTFLDSGGNPPPNNYVLASFRVELVEYRTTTEDYILGIQTDSSTSSALNRRSDFESAGGVIYWPKEPALNVTSGKADLALRFGFRHHTNTIHNIDSRHVYISSAKVKVSAEWVPAQADVDAYRLLSDQTRRDLVRACTEERLNQIRDLAIADYPGQVLAAAVADHFLPLQETVHLRHVLDFENAFVESTPYWASDSGRANYLALERRLIDLPIPVPIHALLSEELTAPQAVVYLPVFAGHELEALDLLPGILPSSRQEVAEDIGIHRAAKFGVASTQLPTYDQVLGPIPPFGTPVGSAAWANPWETPQQKFDVLAHWQVLTPTDGLHMETRLSDSVASDEHLTRMLEKQAGD